MLQMLIKYEDNLLDMNTHVYRISVDLIKQEVLILAMLIKSILHAQVKKRLMMGIYWKPINNICLMFVKIAPIH